MRNILYFDRPPSQEDFFKVTLWTLLGVLVSVAPHDRFGVSDIDLKAIEALASGEQICRSQQEGLSLIAVDELISDIPIISFTDAGNAIPQRYYFSGVDDEQLAVHAYLATAAVTLILNGEDNDIAQLENIVSSSQLNSNLLRDAYIQFWPEISSLLTIEEINRVRDTFEYYQTEGLRQPDQANVITNMDWLPPQPSQTQSDAVTSDRSADDATDNGSADFWIELVDKQVIPQALAQYLIDNDIKVRPYESESGAASGLTSSNPNSDTVRLGYTRQGGQVKIRVDVLRHELAHILMREIVANHQPSETSLQIVRLVDEDEGTYDAKFKMFAYDFLVQALEYADNPDPHYAGFNHALLSLLYSPSLGEGYNGLLLFGPNQQPLTINDFNESITFWVSDKGFLGAAPHSKVRPPYSFSLARAVLEMVAEIVRWGNCSDMPGQFMDLLSEAEDFNLLSSVEQ